MGKKELPELELVIESIGFEGVSIARHEGKVHFIEAGIPGDRVRAKLYKNKSSYAEGKIVEIITPSPRRISSQCKHFGTCGGCKWQHMMYEDQLMWKRNHVIDSFQRLGKIPFGVVKDTLPSPAIFNYRNKMEFSFGASRWLTEQEMGDESITKDFALGLHIPGRFDKVLDVQECYLADERASNIIHSIRTKALELGVKAHHARNHTGFLRNLIVRTARKGEELMVVLITSSVKESEESSFIDWFKNEFIAEHTTITSCVWAVTDSLSGVAIGEIQWYKGNNFIIEEIEGVKFRISPFSFFQTNGEQLEPFIQSIVETAELKASDIVWDCYCGAGSITLPASKHCQKIYGFELSESSIKDADNNRIANKIDNAEFFHEDLHKQKAIEKLRQFEKPDVIILDPPRAGIHEMLLRHLLHIESPKIVYVSCNPATQARDCAILHEKYDVVSLQPVDMFPHTYHVENIALLTLRT